MAAFAASDAGSDHAEGAPERDLSRLPRDRGYAPGRAGARGGRAASAGVRAVHDDRHLEDPETLRSALAGVDGLDADSVVGRIDDPEVVAAYEADRAGRARRRGRPPSSRAGRRTPTARCATPPRRWSSRDPTGGAMEAGGFSRSRPTTSSSPTWSPRSSAEAPAAEAVEVLSAFPYALTTAEVAAVMTPAPRGAGPGRGRGRAYRRHR